MTIITNRTACPLTIDGCVIRGFSGAFDRVDHIIRGFGGAFDRINRIVRNIY